MLPNRPKSGDGLFPLECSPVISTATLGQTGSGFEMTKQLSCRERVLRTIARRTDIDRMPLVFRAEPPLMQRLRAELVVEDDEAVYRHFGADSIQVGVAFHPDPRRSPDKEGKFTDLFGNRFQAVKDGDLESYSVIEPVLANAASPDDLKRVNWPGADALALEECVRKATSAHNTGLAVYGGIWASVFTTSRNLMGEEDFLLATIENPALVAAVIDRLTQSYLEMNRAYLSATRGLIDVYYFGSDLGTQRSMFISPEMCRQFIIPAIGRLARQAKEFGLPVMYHTCGSVAGIVDDLIACGVDVLDPVQVSALGMEPAGLAERFKGRIAFHGGISTQTTLPNGTREEVREIVHRTIRALGPTGYIAGPDQEMIGQVPLVNIEAMCQAVRDFALQAG
jgi:uroporphyrinogen decarboxylase